MKVIIWKEQSRHNLPPPRSIHPSNHDDRYSKRAELINHKQYPSIYHDLENIRVRLWKVTQGRLPATKALRLDAILNKVVRI